MNLLEVSPRGEHLHFFLTSALTWLRRLPDSAELWVDHGIGRRLAKWLIVTKGDPELVTDEIRSSPRSMTYWLVSSKLVWQRLTT